MANIFNVNAWSASASYSIHDIVSYGGYYYYALKNGPTETPSSISSEWGGMLIGTNNETKPNFIWEPNYDHSSDITPRIKSIQFGDGYEQRASDGINNILLSFDFEFRLRTEAECAAIVHFLTTRAGYESFWFTPPSPFSALKKFVCQQYNTTKIFFNNNSVKAKFIESVT